MTDPKDTFLDSHTFTKLGKVRRARVPAKRAWLAVQPKLVGSKELADYLKAIDVLPPEATTAWFAECTSHIGKPGDDVCIAEDVKIYYTMEEGDEDQTD